MKKLLAQFGAKVMPKHEEAYQRSPQWDGSKFLNIEETTIDIDFQKIPKLLYKQFCERAGREPTSELPVAPFAVDAFMAPSKETKLIWYGHSAILLRIEGKTIFIDPMMGPNASPIAPWKTKRFTGSLLHLIEQIPEIDLVLMSHDHYDHLDLDSIRKLIPKTRQWITALGVGRHLESWGVAADRITELYWWQEKSLAELDIIFTPTRHFSGRGARDRAQSLWGGWVLRTAGESIYFSGDSGYGSHFKEVGNRLGPFDLGLMECGQYNKHWAQIHMRPEESVQAAIDAGVSKAIPVHWAGFSLAMHTWTEPVDLFVSSATEKSLPIVIPPLGAVFSASDERYTNWWK